MVVAAAGTTAGLGGAQPSTSTVTSAEPRSSWSRKVPSPATGTTAVEEYSRAVSAVTTATRGEVAVARA